MTRPTDKTPPATGHLIVPAAAIGAMSLALVVGLEWIGLLDTLNQLIADSLSRGGLETYPKRLPEWCPWLAAAVFPFGLAFAMMATQGVFRRASLWLTVIFLLATWGPVLSLAAHAPNIAGPWIATLWAGFCAMVHASRSLMPANTTPKAKPPR